MKKNYTALVTYDNGVKIPTRDPNTASNKDKIRRIEFSPDNPKRPKIFVVLNPEDSFLCASQMTMLGTDPDSTKCQDFIQISNESGTHYLIVNPDGAVWLSRTLDF